MPTIKHSLGTGPYQMEWTSVSTQTRVSVICWLTRPRATLSSKETKLWTCLAWGQPADPYDVPALEIPSTVCFLQVSLCWVSQLGRTVWDFFPLANLNPCIFWIVPSGKQHLNCRSLCISLWLLKIWIEIVCYLKALLMLLFPLVRCTLHTEYAPNPLASILCCINL